MTNNAVEPKKRPLSSMSPTIVLKDGQPVLTVGGAGGPKIITEVLWAIINHLDLEMPIGEADRQNLDFIINGLRRNLIA